MLRFCGPVLSGTAGRNYAFRGDLLTGVFAAFVTANHVLVDVEFVLLSNRQYAISEVCAADV